MSHSEKSLRGLFFLCPILVFFSYHFYFSVNTPQDDEIRTTVSFLLEWIQNVDFLARIQLLFSSENESRPVFYRIIVVLIYVFSDKINFTFLMFLGNLSMVFLAYLLSSQIPIQKYSFLAVGTLTTLLFQPQYYFSSFRADASIFYFYGILFPCLSFYFLLKKTNASIFLAFLFLSFSILNSAVCLFVLPFFIGILIYKKKYFLFFPASIFTVFGYFLILYNPISGNSSSRLLDGLSINFVKCLHISLTFLGSFAQIDSKINLVFLGIVGLGILIVCFYFFYLFFFSKISPTYTDSQLFLIAFCSHILLVILLFGFTRWVGDYQNTLTELSLEHSKKMYPMLVLIILLILYFQNFKSGIVISSLICSISLLFCIYSYITYTPEVAYNKRLLILDKHEFLSNKSLVSIRVSPQNPVVMTAYQGMINQNLWNFPKTFYDNSYLVNKKEGNFQNISLDIKAKTVKNQDIDGITKSFLSIKNETLDYPLGNDFEGIYLVLSNKTSEYFLPTLALPNSKMAFIKTGKQFRKGFYTEFQNVYPAGQYQIGLWIYDGKKSFKLWTNSKVIL